MIAIAILFATRKFLFVAFDESERIIFRSNEKVRHVNRLIHANIPYEDDETLLEVLLKKMKQDEVENRCRRMYLFPEIRTPHCKNCRMEKLQELK